MVGDGAEDFRPISCEFSMDPPSFEAKVDEPGCEDFVAAAFADDAGFVGGPFVATIPFFELFSKGFGVGRMMELLLGVENKFFTTEDL